MRPSLPRSLQMVFIFGGVALASEALAQRHLFTEFRSPEILKPREVEFFGSASIYQTKDGEEYSGWYSKRAFLGLGLGLGRFTELNLEAGSFDVSNNPTDSNFETLFLGLRRNVVMTLKYALTSGLEYEYWNNQMGDSLNFGTDFSARVNKWASLYAAGAVGFGGNRTKTRLNLGLAAHSLKWFNFGLEADLTNQFDHFEQKDYESKAGVSVMFIIGPARLKISALTNPNPTRGTFFEALSTLAIKL